MSARRHSADDADAYADAYATELFHVKQSDAPDVPGQTDAQPDADAQPMGQPDAD